MHQFNVSGLVKLCSPFHGKMFTLRASQDGIVGCLRGHSHWSSLKPMKQVQGLFSRQLLQEHSHLHFSLSAQDFQSHTLQECGIEVGDSAFPGSHPCRSCHIQLWDSNHRHHTWRSLETDLHMESKLASSTACSPSCPS